MCLRLKTSYFHDSATMIICKEFMTENWGQYLEPNRTNNISESYHSTVQHTIVT